MTLFVLGSVIQAKAIEPSLKPTPSDTHNIQVIIGYIIAACFAVVVVLGVCLWGVSKKDPVLDEELHSEISGVPPRRRW